MQRLSSSVTYHNLSIIKSISIYLIGIIKSKTGFNSHCFIFPVSHFYLMLGIISIPAQVLNHLSSVCYVLFCFRLTCHLWLCVVVSSGILCAADCFHMQYIMLIAFYCFILTWYLLLAQFHVEWCIKLLIRDCSSILAWFLKNIVMDLMHNLLIIM